jgi:hypothetical protein
LSALLVPVAVFVGLVLGALLWSSARGPRTRRLSAPQEEDCFTVTCEHLPNLPQIRQVLDSADIEYLTRRGRRETAKRVRRERRRIVAAYLTGLREDFDRLMEATTKVAAFSPKVEASQEFRRFRLALVFRVKYTLLRVKFAAGVLSFSGLGNLAWMLSSLAIDLERAMNEVAAAAALANSHSRSRKS